MIKFFRKIRQNLLSEGKTGKYLKYAIGEIVLVVIGIMIALSINNWNEGRKETIKLKKAIESVYSDLVSDRLLINEGLPLVDQRNTIITNLLRRSYATEANLDSLVQIMKND